MTLISPAATSPGHELPQRTAGGGRGRVLRELARRPLAMVAAAYLAIVVILAIGASWLAPDGPQQEDLAHVLSGPSQAHWLGTDRLGRDVLSRLMFGGRITLLGVAEAVIVFAGLGITLGLVAGFTGGWTDRLIARFGDLVLALPGIIVLLMVLSVFPGNELATMVALGLLSCPTLLRVVRGATLTIRGETYIKAARLSGLTSARIMSRHVLPRLRRPDHCPALVVRGGGGAGAERAVVSRPQHPGDARSQLGQHGGRGLGCDQPGPVAAGTDRWRARVHRHGPRPARRRDARRDRHPAPRGAARAPPARAAPPVQSAPPVRPAPQADCR